MTIIIISKTILTRSIGSSSVSKLLLLLLLLLLLPLLLPSILRHGHPRTTRSRSTPHGRTIAAAATTTTATTAAATTHGTASTTPGYDPGPATFRSAGSRSSTAAAAVSTPNVHATTGHTGCRCYANARRTTTSHSDGARDENSTGCYSTAAAASSPTTHSSRAPVHAHSGLSGPDGRPDPPRWYVDNE